MFYDTKELIPARCKQLIKIVNYQSSEHDLHNLETYDTINPKLKTVRKEIQNEK